MTKINSDIDWADVVDILAREYGWTIEYIKTLDLCQIGTLLRTIKNRYEKQNGNGSSEDVNNNDKELSVSDFKAMGGKERIREDGRKEIII